MHRLIIAGLLAAMSSGVQAADVEASSVQATFTYAAGTDSSDTVAAEIDLQPSVEFAFGDSVSWVASARVRLDAYDQLEPGRTNTDSYSPASKPVELGTAGSAEIRDLYLEFRRDNGLLRIGKQQIVWGRLDGIKVLDLVNPQDYREFILDDFDESRISLWSVYADYSVGPWRAELALVADGTGHAIPNEGAWFELTAPRFRFGTAGASALPVITDRPGAGFDSAAAGFRVSRQFGGLDLSAVAYTGLDPEPLGRLGEIDGQTALERYYERRDALGTSLDVGLGDFVLRAEAVLMPDRVFNTRDGTGLDTIELDQFRAAIGVDYSAPFDIFMNVQYLVDRVRAAPVNLVRPDTDRIGTLFLRRSFGFDRLDIELRWYHSFEDADDMSSLGATWRPNDRTSIRVAWENFEGAQDGLFGQFDGRSRALLSVEYLL